MFFRDRICHRRQQAQTRIMRHRARSRASRHPFVPEGLQFRSRARIARAHIRPIRGVRSNTTVRCIPRRQGRSKAGRTKGTLQKSNWTPRSNKKNRHGKFRALHGGDSDDGDGMAKKLTGEIPNKEAFTVALSQTEHLIKQKSQNSVTSNIYKP